MTFLTAIWLALPAGLAHANPYGDKVQMRLLPGWRMADGTYMAGLELRLAPGWKTYWRAPGDAGVPPVLNWSGSRNLSDLRVTWPMPQVFAQSGMRTIGYSGDVVLPLAISARRMAKPIRLSGRIEIGICNEVCVPLQLTLNETLDTTNTTPDPAIIAALAERPFSAKEAGVTSVTCTLKPTGKGVTLRAEINVPSTGKGEVAVVETDDPMVWASEPRLTRRGPLLIAETDLIHATANSFALDRSALRFTIFGSSHAVDIHGCGRT